MTTIVTTAPNAERRTDLDWVRIIAFGLLIFYHVACFYWPGTPHNQALSPRGVPWLIVPMLAVNPWRLLILFIVSGAATRFMADKMTPGALFKLRNARLGPPLLFVTAVIVPPMGFAAARQWDGFHGDFFNYLVRHVSSIGPNGVNYGHLWFVAYLFVYTVALVGVLAAAPRAMPALQRGLERVLHGWGLIVWPAAYLALARFALSDFPQTMNLIWDWYSHAIFLAGFLLGFSLAKSDAIWASLEAWRGRLLAGALTVYALLIASAVIALGADFNWGAKAAAHTAAAAPAPLMAYSGVIYGLDQWLWIAAAFGFAHRYLNERDGPVRRYLTEAIFPFYIIHELTITVGGHYLSKLGLNLGLEAAVLIAMTVLSCLVTYEIARRVSWLRPLFGLKPVPAYRASAAARWPAPDSSEPMYER
jgi:peptidoglycan/LPS O-acetylase OafA/YrhL